MLQYAWKIGNVAVRELADHAPINYVSGIIGMIPYCHPHVYGQKLVAPLSLYGEVYRAAKPASVICSAI